MQFLKIFRELMSHSDKKNEKVLKELEETRGELQAAREKLKENEKNIAAEQAWFHERESLMKELDNVKTRFARTQRVERAKFLEFYKIINELREEINILKTTPAPVVSNEQVKRLTEENEKQAKRLREQRDFIDELMKGKEKLMEQIATEVKRRAALTKENAVLHDTIRQQLNMIEITDQKRGADLILASQSPIVIDDGLTPPASPLVAHSNGPAALHIAKSPTQAPSLITTTSPASPAAVLLEGRPQSTPTTGSPSASPAPMPQARVPMFSQPRMQRDEIERHQESNTVQKSKEQTVDGETMRDNTDEMSVCSSELLVDKTNGQEKMVVRTRGNWLGTVPIVGRLYGEKELPKTYEFVL